MENNILSILPVYGSLTKRLAEIEKDLAKEYGMPIKITASNLSANFCIDTVAKIVSDVLSCPIADMIGNTKAAKASEARQVCMYICRKNLKLTCTDIGKYFKKDHTAVTYSVRRVQELLDTKDAIMTTKINNCISHIKSIQDGPISVHKTE